MWNSCLCHLINSLTHVFLMTPPLKIATLHCYANPLSFSYPSISNFTKQSLNFFTHYVKAILLKQLEVLWSMLCAKTKQYFPFLDPLILTPKDRWLGVMPKAEMENKNCTCPLIVLTEAGRVKAAIQPVCCKLVI